MPNLWKYRQGVSKWWFGSQNWGFGFSLYFFILLKFWSGWYDLKWWPCLACWIGGVFAVQKGGEGEWGWIGVWPVPLLVPHKMWGCRGRSVQGSAKVWGSCEGWKVKQSHKMVLWQLCKNCGEGEWKVAAAGNGSCESKSLVKSCFWYPASIRLFEGRFWCGFTPQLI